MTRPTIGRQLMAVGGIALIGVGLFNLLVIDLVDLLWLGCWLAIGLVLHDGFLAPATAAVSKLAADRWAAKGRGVLLLALVSIAGLSLIAAPMMIQRDSVAGNPTLLGRNYFVGWAVACLLVLLGVVLAEVIGRVRAQRRKPQSTAPRCSTTSRESHRAAPQPSTLSGSCERPTGGLAEPGSEGPVTLSIIETNEVHLIGRLGAPPAAKTLPGGEAAVAFRVSVTRPPEAVRRQKSDSIDCICSRAATIKAAAGWAPGDVLEVNGALHHRFWRAGSETQNVYEVEVRTVRRLSRAQATKPARRAVAEGVG